VSYLSSFTDEMTKIAEDTARLPKKRLFKEYMKNMAVNSLGYGAGVATGLTGAHLVSKSKTFRGLSSKKKFMAAQLLITPATIAASKLTDRMMKNPMDKAREKVKDQMRKEYVRKHSNTSS